MPGSALYLAMLLFFLSPASPGPLYAASPEAPQVPLWQEALERIDAGDYQSAVLLLDNLRRREGFSKTSEANLLLGIVLFRLARWQEAADTLEVAATQIPLLGDYALYHAASAYEALGLHSRALTTLTRLLHEYPESLLVERVRQQRAQLYRDGNQLTLAEEAYKEYLSYASSEARRREALLALAEIALMPVPDLERGANKRQEAEALLRELWLKWPGSREAARAGELLTSMAEAAPFTRDEQFERALTLYRNGHYAQAVAAFTPFMRDSRPPSDGAQDRFAPRARLWSGISSFHLREYHRTIELLSPLSRDRSVHAAESLYWIGRCFARLDDNEKAIITWDRLIRTYPNSPYTSESLYLLALQYNDGGRPKLAIRALTQLLRHYPSSRFTEAALWTRAWISYRQSSFAQALADLRRLHEKAGPDSRFDTQALYWQGRILERLSKRTKAIEAYQGLLSTYGDNEYYAEQARRRLGTLDRKATQSLPLASPPAEPIQASAVPLSVPRTASSEVEKARLLKDLSLREEASEEYWALIGRYAEDRGLLHEACSAFVDLGHLDKSVRIAKRLLRPLYARTRPVEPVPGYWEFLYPLGYRSLVQEQSAQHALDPYLVTALIREESAFGERVISSSGAVGLMQLLPSTADHLIKTAGKPGVSAKLEVPAHNIALGTQYLAMMLNEFKGNWARALAAYNAGPNQVRRWLGRLDDRPDEEFIEEIPFSETRGYVKRVLGSYYRYRTQYGKTESLG